MNRCLMENMKFNGTNIRVLKQEEMGRKKCWGCEKKVRVVYFDSTTGGYICQTCMPDIYYADKVLSNVDGLRSPEPNEITDSQNN